MANLMQTLHRMVNEEKKEEQQELTPQQQMRQHLTMLQNWGPDANDYNIEERRAAHAQGMLQRQIERNELLHARAEAHLPKAKAKKKAEGSPKQTQKPAGGGVKGWRERRRQRAEARLHNPAADEISYCMMEGLRDERAMINNSIGSAGGDELISRAVKNNVDTRILQTFIYGYRKGADGEPETALDAKHREEDKQFLEDYISCDAVRRKPHLDRIVEDMFKMNITEDMLRPEYLKDHAGEMHNKVGRMVYFDNIYRDPKNRDYFDALPKIKHDFIETRVLSRYAVIGTALDHAFATKAISFDNREYYPYEKGIQNGARQMMVDTYEPTMELAKQIIAESKEKEKEFVAQEMERQIKNESVQPMEDARKKKLEAETMNRDIGGLNMTGFVTGFSFDEPSKYRKMIEDHPETYQQNPELIDWLYQEFYRGIDAMGDYTLRALAVQSAMDRIRLENEVIHTAEQAVSDALSKEQDKLEVECDMLRAQINALGDALSAQLRGTELSPAGAAVINRYATENKKAQV